MPVEELIENVEDLLKEQGDIEEGVLCVGCNEAVGVDSPLLCFCEYCDRVVCLECVEILEDLEQRCPDCVPAEIDAA